VTLTNNFEINLSENLCPNIQNLGLKSFVLKKFIGKTEILSTRVTPGEEIFHRANIARQLHCDRSFSSELHSCLSENFNFLSQLYIPRHHLFLLFVRMLIYECGATSDQTATKRTYTLFIPACLKKNYSKLTAKQADREYSLTF